MMHSIQWRFAFANVNIVHFVGFSFHLADLQGNQPVQGGALLPHPSLRRLGLLLQGAQPVGPAPQADHPGHGGEDAVAAARQVFIKFREQDCPEQNLPNFSDSYHLVIGIIFNRSRRRPARPPHIRRPHYRQGLRRPRRLRPRR